MENTKNDQGPKINNGEYKELLENTKNEQITQRKNDRTLRTNREHKN